MRALWRGGLVVLLPVVLGAGTPARPGPAVAPGHSLVVIAARDLAAGERVTEKDVVSIEVPADWAPPSIIDSESREEVLDKRVQLPVLKGDMITWSLFESTSEARLVEGCAQAVGLPASASEQVARLRQLFIENPPSGP